MPPTTMTTRQISELSREELYEIVWTTPGSRLAAEFGISDVAIAKHCTKLGVPRPSRGYWAKWEAGIRPERSPLPPSPDQVFQEVAAKPVDANLPIPQTSESLCALAGELLARMGRCRVDSDGRARLQEPTVPKVVASKKSGLRVAQAFHVILAGVEPVGINFRKSQSSYDGGHFRRGHDRLYLEFEELLVPSDKPVRRRSIWQGYGQNQVPGGLLKISIRSQRYGSEGAREWIESEKNPLESVLSKIVSAIRQHFVALQKRRAAEAIERKRQHLEWERRQKEWAEKEAIRRRLEEEQRHAASVLAAQSGRRDNLLKAADQWRASRSLEDFIRACEQNWRSSSEGLSQVQEAWIAWAQGVANRVSPIAMGYPDPSSDGEFDLASIPFGGPYPSVRPLTERRAPQVPVNPDHVTKPVTVPTSISCANTVGQSGSDPVGAQSGDAFHKPGSTSKPEGEAPQAGA